MTRSHDPVPVPVFGDEARLRSMAASKLDRPGSQGHRGQESPDTWLRHRHVLVVTDDASSVVLGIVGRPLTAVRPVEPPTTPSLPPLPSATQVKPRGRMIPWASLTLMLTGQVLVGAVTAVGSLPPLVGAATAASITACGVVLVVAELVHRAGAR